MHYEDVRKEEMYKWFHKHFILPEVCAPRMSGEYGYQNVCGGPYFAGEIIEKTFANKYPKNILDEVVSDLDNEGNEWTKSKHFDYN